MKKRYLSDSGPKVSEAIYGFWRWEDKKEETTAYMEKVVNLCLDLGINTFDHADSYGNSTAETHFGKVLERKSIKREDIILFTKSGVRNSSRGFTYYDHSRKHILESVETSLKNLKTDYIDIFLLNQFDPLANLEETANVLSNLVNQGKVKHIGVSNFTVFQHQLLASYLSVPIVTNHLELNLLNISPIKDGRIDFLKQRYSTPLAWSPLAGGRIFEGKDVKAALIRSKLAEIGERYNANVEQIAVAWLLQLGTLPIIGTLSEDRIKNAATAVGITLSYEDWYELHNLAGLDY